MKTHETINDLAHVKVRTKRGALVMLLNTGSVINAEAEAMLQALHSRSTKGVEEHLKTLAKRGPEKFMSQFYVGYGHKSIGDLGTVTLFVEGISMLAAKAIQDSQLYSGQESSTRYIDFSTQPFLNPRGTKAGETILEKWRAFYIAAMNSLIESLKERYPRTEGEDEKVYEKAIKARAFDILRSFLPAGATTNLAWHTNLRQAADKLALLRHHPLAEVREIAEAIEEVLRTRYPSSFGHKRYPETERYNAELMRHYYFHDPKSPLFRVEKKWCNKKLLKQEEVQELLRTRPAKTELPKWFAELGGAQYAYVMDFGSYRDIQRHRAVTQRMPLVTTELGFEPWYLKELPRGFRLAADALLREQEEAIAKLKATPEERQYYVAMGYRVANRMTGDLPALVYIAELRSSRFVHPTARRIAFKIARVLERQFGRYGLVLHLDDEKNRFDVGRGKQDIILKK